MSRKKDLYSLVARVDERLDQLIRNTEQVEKCLYGNGQPGLISRVQTLEDLHKNENSFFRKFATIGSWIVTTAIAVYALFKK